MSLAQARQFTRRPMTVGGPRSRRLFFPRLFDRRMQNLRRCVGYKVQYFGAIEPQRRLAPHIQRAMRNAIPRATICAVTKATYLQLWWPYFDQGRERKDPPGPGHRLPATDLRPDPSTTSKLISMHDLRW